MKVEVVEDCGILEAGVKYKKGSVLVCDEPHEVSMAKKWIDCGWAKDVDTGEIGKRVEGVAKVTPTKTKIQLKEKK